MRLRAREVVLGAALFVLGWTDVEAQGYRLRLDTRAQRVAFRGITADSIPVGEVVTGPTGGPRTADGYAVRCPPGSAHCFYFRPGPRLRSGPITATADLTLWGMGIRGLTARVNGRLGLDLGAEEVWPGTEPALQLIEAYAEYARGMFTARAGRQLLVSRLGIVGFDGGRATARIGRSGVDAEAYVGLGLARATALPVTSPALDPLDEFQPRSRQILAGAAVGYRGPRGDVRLDYQREVDRESRNYVSERTALSLDLSPVDRWSVVAGIEYDLANTWLGNVEGSVRYTSAWLTALAGLRRYRPHFDLWTVWGAFSPVPYHAANTAVWIRPFRGVELRGRYERYHYAETETSTPLVDVDDDGWRLGAGVTYTPARAWRLDAGYREEFGPGASSEGFEGSVTWIPGTALSLTAYGSTLDRPLEFRFQDASVEVFGLDVDWRPGDRLAVGAGVAHFAEGRDRPDAAAFDWNQTRVHARATLFLRSEADAFLPPPIRGRRAGLR